MKEVVLIVGHAPFVIVVQDQLALVVVVDDQEPNVGAIAQGLMKVAGCLPALKFELHGNLIIHDAKVD